MGFFSFVSAAFVALFFAAAVRDSSAAAAVPPEFQYAASPPVVPTWATTTFLLTRYKDSVAVKNNNIRNRLHVEFFYDDPTNSSLTYDPVSHYYVQSTNRTPDPYGILAGVYKQLLNINSRFVFPTITMTIPLNVSSAANASDLKWFVQGFKPDGLSYGGVQIKYMVKPSIVVAGSSTTLQMTMPLVPFQQTWCSPDQQPYRCPPGSPWNAGIPYMHPMAVNIDVNDALFAAFRDTVSSDGAVASGVEFLVFPSKKVYAIPRVPTTFRFETDASMPAFQADGEAQPDGSVVYPPLKNGL